MTFLAQIHPFDSATRHSCAYELFPSTSSTQPRHALVFIGGLGDGPQTVPFIRTVAQTIQDDPKLNYSVFETRLRSSFSDFGRSSLKKDVEDIGSLVRYLRSLGKEKVVLMGHSTGSQDCTAYALDGPEPVDGFILQAPASDREGMVPGFASQEYVDAGLEIAKTLIEQGQSDALMPMDKTEKCFDVPITAYRFQSLLIPGGDDDFFSTDLTDDQSEAVWSRFKKPLLLVPSADDQYYCRKIPYDDLIKKWTSFCPRGIVSDFSGAVPGANHTVDAEDARKDISERVVMFLRMV